MNKIRSIFINFLACVLIAIFPLQNVLWAIPETAGECVLPSALQVQSMLNPIANPKLFHQSLIEFPLKYVIESTDIEKFNRRLSPPVYQGIRLVLDFSIKYKQKGKWVIPCSITDTANGYVWLYEALVDPDRSIALRAGSSQKKVNIKVRSRQEPDMEVKLDRIIRKFGKRTHKPRSVVEEIEKPLLQIDAREIRNILIFTEKKAFEEKLGETVIDLWPLAATLSKKFPDAPIYVTCDFPDIFQPKMFEGRIIPLNPEEMEELRGSFNEKKRFLRENNIDMVFDISVAPGHFNNLTSQDFPESGLPYIFKISSPISLMSAVVPFTTEVHPYNFFQDRKGKEYRIAGGDKIMHKVAVPYPAGSSQYEHGYRWQLNPSGGWLLALETCRILGLEISKDTLDSVEPTPGETMGALKWLKELRERSAPEGTLDTFDPRKKIIVVNVYAVTQHYLMDEEDWVNVILELSRGIHNSYLIFTHGGRMDQDWWQVERIVKKARNRLALENITNGIEIVLPRKDIYPHIHALLGITSAVVSLDTGLTHLSSGIYNIPTAIITTPTILHWLPPRDNVMPIIARADLYPGSTFSLFMEWDKEKNRQKIISDMRKFVELLNRQPERFSARIAKIAAVLSEENAEPGGQSNEEDVSEPLLRDLTGPEDLSLNLVETVLSLLTTRKVVLAFDSKIGGHQSSMVLAVLSELEKLKKDPKFGRLLSNLAIVRAAPNKLPQKLESYIDEENTEVFMFARKCERGVLEKIETKVHPVYIEEKGFPLDAYYPLPEIVTIALTQFLDQNTLKTVSPMLEKLNIGKIEEQMSTLVFTLLPGAVQHDKQELMERYASLKRLLKAA